MRLYLNEFLELSISMEIIDYLKDSIFRIGEVYAVNGREIIIKVDSNKNLPHVIYKGRLIKNVSVGSFLKIKKGFYNLVAKVESETLKENISINSDPEFDTYKFEKDTAAFVRIIVGKGRKKSTILLLVAVPIAKLYMDSLPPEVN